MQLELKNPMTAIPRLNQYSEVLHHTFSINIEIQRDANSLERKRGAFKLGQLHTVVLAKLINSGLSRLDDFRNNDPKLLIFQVKEGELLIHFSGPKRDKQVKILKIFPLRGYLRENRLKVYGGARYFMANATDDCTRFIDTTDDEPIVKGSCMETGSTLIFTQTTSGLR